MLHSIVSTVKPVFSRYAYSLSCSRNKCSLYFRPTCRRERFKITLTLQDNGAIDFYYETIGFTESTSRYSKESAISLLTHYIKASLNLYH